MNLLELRMNYSAFVKLRDFVKINDISAEIKDYLKKEDIVVGKLEVNGTYLVEDLVTSSSFSEEIPFNIIFSTNDFEILDIDCVELDYNVVDGRGIEVLFDILLKYEQDDEIDETRNFEEVINKENNEEKIIDEEHDVIEIPVLINENQNFEEISETIKENKEKEIDSLIEEELNEVIDNHPTIEEKQIEQIVNEKRSIIKICYYKKSSDLDSVCLQNNVGIDKVFNDNKKTDFEKYRRVILK